MWINTKNFEIYNHIYEIRNAFQNISLPEKLNENNLNDIGVYEVVNTTPPNYDPIYQKLIELKPQENNGKWIQNWTIEQATTNEIEININKTYDKIIELTQKKLDEFAKTRFYDGILSLCTYSSSSNTKFETEGKYGVKIRDDTWKKIYEIMESVNNGIRKMPTSFLEIESELPVFEWPNIG